MVSNDHGNIISENLIFAIPSMAIVTYKSIVFLFVPIIRAINTKKNSVKNKEVKNHCTAPKGMFWLLIQKIDKKMSVNVKSFSE